MKLFLQPDVIEVLLLCALWFAVGFLVCWSFGGLAKLGSGKLTTKKIGVTGGRPEAS